MMAGIHRYHGKNGKYLVLRRDGTIPAWPSFVLGANDPCAVAAIIAYRDEADRRGFDKQFVDDLNLLAYEFDTFRNATMARGLKAGDPDAPLHRKDDPRILAAMDSGVLDLGETSNGD